MIVLDQVSKVYEMGAVKVKAVDHLSLKIESGEFVAVLGPSGSGKSTLMNLIGCLDTPTEGAYFLDEEPVQNLNRTQLAGIRNKKIGFVFQNFNLLAYATALENVELPMIYGRVPGSDRKRRATKILEIVGLGGRVAHRPAELSGGERQRVALARALSNDPEIILADEPTGNLDSKTSKEIVQTLSELNKNQGLTVIMISHEESLLAEFADDIIRLHDGKIVEQLNSKKINENF